ncbi:MAG: FAD-dependent oxidoreductase [Anaerolineae bacterium]
MSASNGAKHLIAVVGAGPAGIYAAQVLADAGATVLLFNRDIKPGGLAEYGIYRDKHKMKEGLRRQFREILRSPHIHYFGNVVVGQQGDLTIDDLRDLGCQAILVTVGAQGTKWLGLAGEKLRGVYHAKDIVFHYNQLPPFSEEDFYIGQHVAIVGVGNVMMDITHWLIREVKVADVVAVARRGPAEVKFTKKEILPVICHINHDRLDAEIQRVSPAMEAVGQDPAAARQFILSAADKGIPPTSNTRFRFEFLASPSSILGDSTGTVCGLEVEDTKLVPANGDTKARGLGTKRVIEADTVIFCIGDKVDESFGLPTEWGEFIKNPTPRYPMEGNSYEAFDPASGQPIEDVFVAGWSRKASDGLVGIARKDGTLGAQALMQYLAATEPASAADVDAIAAEVLHRLSALSKRVVSKADWQQLEAAEHAEAQRLGVEEFKYSSNREMLAAIGVN